MNCEKCGAPSRAGAVRCDKCGSAFEGQAPPARVAPPPPGPLDQFVQAVGPMYVQVPAQAQIMMGPPKSKVAAALLAFFFGALGIHNFYLGATGAGIAQLLLTLLTCGWGTIITGPWALIDFICILVGSRRDRFGRPLA